MLYYLRGLGLRWKTVLLLSAGLLAVFGGFGYIAGQTLTQSADVALQESLSQAKVLAASIDGIISRASRQMEGAATILGDEPDPQDQGRTINHISKLMSNFDALWLMDANGQTIWRRSHSADTDTLRTEYRNVALQTAQQGRVIVSQPPRGDFGQIPLAVIGAPIDGPDGGPRTALVGEVSFDDAGSGSAPLANVTPTSEFYIIDAAGRVTEDRSNKDRSYRSEHLALLSSAIQSRRPGVKRHRTALADDHVVAFVPLGSLSGGVIFEEHSDQVLTIPHRLRRSLLIMGSTAMVLASGGAWLYVRHMVQPVLALREASDRIASGNLRESVEIERRDEIGDLARAFDSMRVRLLEAEEEHIEWEQQLQDRVRTQSAQVRQLLGRVISAQETERQRIARELHDGVTQMVMTMLLQIEGMASALPPDSQAAQNLAPAARSSAMQVLEEMRRVIMDLRPPALDDLGLAAALRDYADHKLAEAGISFDFEIIGEPIALDWNLETAVYRIIQEAISNLAQHSAATHGSVTVEFRPGMLRAEIVDDGKGFVLEEVMQTASGVGIAGMFERTDILGGRLSVISEPGRGTELRLEVPIDPT